MKRTILLTLLSVITLGMMANPVGREEAREKAAKFLCTSRTAKIKNLQLMQSKLQPVEAGFSYLHVFNNGEDDGFVVVSADDRTEGVLAYSEGGSFDEVNVNLSALAFAGDFRTLISRLSPTFIVIDGDSANRASSAI